MTDQEARAASAASESAAAPAGGLSGRPGWIRVRRLSAPVRAMMQRELSGIATVCREANCPNIGECWARGTATYMIMGDTCTRNCAFCDVRFGRPKALDPLEPEKLARSVSALGLRYSVITCVDRDDLPDSGSAHWAACIRALRRQCGALELAPAPGNISEDADIFTLRYRSGLGIEVLTGDFKGRREDIAATVLAGPDVFAHNVETVPRLQKLARHKASWERSIRVLMEARAIAQQAGQRMLVKSGMMLGLGETDSEVREALGRLREAGVELLTLGQYLRPRNVEGKLPVLRFVSPEEFSALREYALGLGFRGVSASPLTRSSHLAETLYALAAD